jgi:peroxiredoxin
MPHPISPRRYLTRAAVAAIGLTALASCGVGAGATATSQPASTTGAGDGASGVATVGRTAPAGTFTTVGGATIDVASYRGTPTVLWFIATDCSSCTASIPTVADHLDALRADGVHVAVVDLYGDLGQGSSAAHALSQVEHHLAGAKANDPTWTWGISSRDLSYRYDQFGAPDVYYVIDRTGRITYRNGVPVSTMSDLLRHAHAAAQSA